VNGFKKEWIPYLGLAAGKPILPSIEVHLGSLRSSFISGFLLMSARRPFLSS